MPSRGSQRSPVWPWQQERPERSGHSLSSSSASSSKPLRLRRILSIVLWYSLLGVGIFELVLLTIHSAAGPNDFCQDYASAVSLLHGHTAYPPVYCNDTYTKLPGGVEYNSHPPTSIVMYLPFGLLPKLAAMILWGLLSLAAYFMSAYVLLRALHWPVLPGLALFAFGSIFWAPSIYATDVLNMEQVLLLLLVGVWRLGVRKQDSWAGVLLGVACLLKIWPVIFLVIPFLQGRWRLVAVTGVVVVVGTLLALLVEGPSAFLAYAGPVRIAEEGWVALGNPANISVSGVVVGLLVGYSGSPTRTAPLLPDIPASMAVVLGEILSAVLLLGGVGLLCWRRRSLAEESGNLLAFGLLVTLILLAFPLSWSFTLITLFLPAATLVLALRRLPPPPRWWWWLLGASIVLLNIEFVVFFEFIHQFRQLDTLEAIVPTLGLLLFAAAQAYLLARLPGRLPEAGSAPTSKPVTTFIVRAELSLPKMPE